ncbi:LCP family protein [Peterkaempfera bronchialis]|uniref:LytR family transcriptional regulator n=1 Tax=Peterkaempfera bronchialis TaxID=2126346 RepID=A0A345SVS5_9ACTN|nr:LCP family protein [Peterkaempfera bronchialis]AXI77830.1 LytR family transcriptional regulator [Peterkaempfera bronchialis]
MATHDRPAPAGGTPTDSGAAPPAQDAAAIPGQRSHRAAGSSRSSRRKPKSGIKRYLKPISIGAGACVLLTAVSGWLYYEHLNSNIETSKKNLSDAKGKRTAPNAFGQVPLNILLLGSDSRATERARKLGGGKNLKDSPPLADVQMLLHVSADRSNASLISIPRDTMVDIPECRDESGKDYPAIPYRRINESLAHGGPGCTLGTWTEVTKLDIDHFMVIDFGGVVDMAQAVGGVTVCVNMNMYDRKTKIGGTGLKLPKGESKLNAEQSLLWLRTRDAWGSDLNRTKAQRMYLNSLIRKLKDEGTLTNPGRLMDLAEAATNALKVDDGLNTVKKLYDLGTELRKVPANRITTLTVPFLQDPQNKNTVVINKPDADKIWQMLLADVPLDKNGGKKKAAPSASATAPASTPAVDRSTVAVTVRNGTTVQKRAATLATELVGLGFTQAAVGTPGNADAQSETTLTFGASHQAEAQAVAAALKLPASALKESPSGGAPALVIGDDWTDGSTFPVRETPKAGDLPSSVEVKHASDKSDCMQVVPQGTTYTW